MPDIVRPVVVGIDDSPASRGALWWAVGEARIRARPLLVLHALSVSETEPEHARELANDAAATARRLAPGLVVDAVVDDLAAGRALCRRSRTAELVVVASRGLGGFHGLLLGSVSSFVATHADCPVLVVHNGQDWAGPDVVASSAHPVVVGVGPYGSPSFTDEPVLQFAFEEARMRGVLLVALHAWRPPAPPQRSDIRPAVNDVAEIETAERVQLAERLRPW